MLNVECAKKCEEQSQYAMKLIKAVFAFRNFATAASAMLQHASSSVDKKLCAEFKAAMEWFLKNLEVITMYNLHADIIATENNTATTEYWNGKGELFALFRLYIDANVTLTLSPRSFKALVNSIV